MKLRYRINATLLASALLGLVPPGTLHAAEATSADTSAYAPRLIDPSSPPPGEGGNSGTVGPAIAVPELAATAAGRKPATEGDPAVMNQPAVEDIELQMNADVLRYIAFFTGAGRSTFERWLKRSGRYMELFRSVLQKEGLPPDLVHLVFVESGFNVNARSYAAAVGPWQFMRATSQLFGLNVNQWVDERKDPEKATVAAARYLKHLYGIFGDWPLALASYNAGEGTVMRAIKHQGTNNYWELRLPKQTEEYVPQFMAALAISRDPVKYGFADVELDDPMRFDEVALKGAVDLHSVAKLAECSFEQLKELNPSARTSVLRGPNGITTVRVPEGKSEIIQRNLAAGAELPSVNLSVRHRVRRGETLRSIAESYSVSAVELARVNGLGRGRPLRRGQMLTVPSSLRAPQPEVLSADSDDPRASTDYVPARRIGLPGKIDGNSVPIDRVTHTVKRGETLSSIAGKYNVSSSELRQWNRLQVGTVRVGTRLRIRSSGDVSGSASGNGDKSSAPAASTAAESAPARPRPRLHTVVRGESLAAIAGKYDVTITELRQWNELGKDDTLEAGRVLEVSANAVADASTLDAPAGVKKNSNTANAANAKSKSGRTHTVRSGETITEIAGRYDVSVESLRKTNKLRTTKLLVGQKLKLPA